MTDVERQIEALLVASPQPIMVEVLLRHVSHGQFETALAGLQEFWSKRGMRLLQKDGALSLVPSADCIRVLEEAEGKKGRKLSDAAIETLSYLALNQPVTTAELVRGRGVKLFKGVMDSLMDAGLVRASVRRTDSGRAVTYVTTDDFLEHFGLSALADLPTVEELPDLVSLPAADASDGEGSPATA